MFRFLKFLERMFEEPATTALQDAMAGALDADKKALTEQTMAEYHASEQLCCEARAAFQRKRLVRLRQFIHSETNKE